MHDADCPRQAVFETVAVDANESLSQWFARDDNRPLVVFSLAIDLDHADQADIAEGCHEFWHSARQLHGAIQSRLPDAGHCPTCLLKVSSRGAQAVDYLGDRGAG